MRIPGWTDRGGKGREATGRSVPASVLSRINLDYEVLVRDGCVVAKTTDLADDAAWAALLIRLAERDGLSASCIQGYGEYWWEWDTCVHLASCTRAGPEPEGWMRDQQFKAAMKERAAADSDEMRRRALAVSRLHASVVD